MVAGPLDLGFSRWEFQPRPLTWRNGLGVHQDPQADVVDSATRSLANDRLRKQLRIGREKTQDKERRPHGIGPARKSSRECGAWSHAGLSSRELGRIRPPRFLGLSFLI